MLGGATSLAGVAASFVGVAASLAGVAASFVGVAASFAAVAAGLAGGAAGLAGGAAGLAGGAALFVGGENTDGLAAVAVAGPFKPVVGFEGADMTSRGDFTNLITSRLAGEVSHFCSSITAIRALT